MRGLRRSEVTAGAIYASCGVLFLAACTLIAPYDDQFNTELVSFEKDAGSFLPTLNNPTNSKTQEGFDKLNADIAALQTRAKAYDQNERTITEVKLLKDDLNRL
jgi:hypothetical protein